MKLDFYCCDQYSSQKTADHFLQHQLKEAPSESSQTSKMELFAKIINLLKTWTPSIANAEISQSTPLVSGEEYVAAVEN